MQLTFLYFLALGIPAFLFFYWGIRQFKKQLFIRKGSLVLKQFVRGLSDLVDVSIVLLMTLSFGLSVYNLNFGIPFFVFGFLGVTLVFHFFFLKFYLKALFQSFLFLRSLEQLLAIGNSYSRSLSLLKVREQNFMIRKVLRSASLKQDKIFSFLNFLFTSLQEASSKGLSVKKTVDVYAEHFYQVITLEREKVELGHQATFQMLIAFIIPWMLWGLLGLVNTDFLKVASENFLLLFVVSLLWNGVGVVCLRRKLKVLLLR